MSTIKVPMHKAVPTEIAKEAGLVEPEQTLLWYVPLDQISINSAAQRTRNDNNPVLRKDTDYRPASVRPIECLLQNNILWVVEGQHSVYRAKEEGYTHIQARVHYGLDSEEEARLFIDYNRNRSNVPQKWLYHVGLTARLPEYVQTERVLKKHKAWVYRETAPQRRTHTITAPGALIRITSKYGAPTLDRTLTAVLSAWPVGAARFQGWVLEGIAPIVDHSGTDRDKLVKLLTGDYPGLRSKIGGYEKEDLTPEKWKAYLNKWSRDHGVSLSSGNRHSRFKAVLVEEYDTFCARSGSTKIAPFVGGAPNGDTDDEDIDVEDDE